MKRTSYEVEMAVRDIVDDITTTHNLEPDFYGDCYPETLRALESRMKFYDDVKYHESLKAARDILMGYIHGDD